MRRSTTTLTPGSSPLARGLREVFIALDAATGIIPARAGFTSHSDHGTTRRPDHPRSRGVYAWTSCHRFDPARIIPARAGFTCRARRWPSWPQDHPRSRGVYSRPDNFLLSIAGSSPLARGLHGPLTIKICQVGSSPLARGLLISLSDGVPFTGIIPARAGFTADSASSDTGHSDHPRSRGVYLPVVAENTDAVGSSPLARGLLGRNLR